MRAAASFPSLRSLLIKEQQRERERESVCVREKRGTRTDHDLEKEEKERDAWSGRNESLGCERNKNNRREKDTVDREVSESESNERKRVAGVRSLD